jgi:hypothetical protein
MYRKCITNNKTTGDNQILKKTMPLKFNILKKQPLLVQCLKRPMGSSRLSGFI